jgi:hypothetical protein
MSKFRQAEVKDLHAPVPEHEKISRLQVAVHYAAPVGCIERVGNLRRIAQGQVERESLLL